MGVNTEKYIRKPLYVDAVRVTASNFDEIVAWCQGEVQTDEVPGTGTTKKFIKVRVHNPKNPRQTKAFIGDWLLYTERGYKVYTNKAFRAAFDQVTTEETQEREEPLPAASGVIEEVEIHSMDVVAEEPSQETGVQPIQSVESAVDEHHTPQGEPHEYVEATPEAIAQAVQENEQARATEGKRILSEEEQEQMGPDAVRELVQSGEVVLAQDLAEAH